jgi:membrane-associated protease RseP (regulator of RpoE activity)
MAAAVVSQGFGKISGAFSRLGDELPSDAASAGSATPHNSQRRNQTSSSNLGGVGIVFSKDQSGYFVVRTLHEGSCAAASGICPGDVIVSVDGAGTQGMSMRQVASAISGAVGSQVTIKIRRGTQSGNVTLERMPGFSKGVVGRDMPLSSAAEDSHRSTNNQSSPVSPDENMSHATKSSHSLPASTMPSERDDEIMAIGSNSNVSFSLKDLARLPAAVASCSDGAARALDSRPTSMPAKRLSKDFERSQLFLELKDPKAINAIVTQDCQHLIDSLASPDAFQGARQRLMSSRTRLPMADMKKVIGAFALVYFVSCTLPYWWRVLSFISFAC